MTTLAASLVENMVKALDGTPVEKPEPTNAKEVEPLVESFYRGLRGGETTHVKDLTRHPYSDPVADFIEQLKRLGAGV